MPAAMVRVSLVAVCIGTENATSSAHSSAVGSQASTDVSSRAHLVPHAP